MNTFLSDKDLSLRFNVGRATIWRWVKRNEFPAPIQLSAGCTRWRSDDVDSWQERKTGAKSQRDA